MGWAERATSGPQDGTQAHRGGRSHLQDHRMAHRGGRSSPHSSECRLCWQILLALPTQPFRKSPTADSGNLPKGKPHATSAMPSVYHPVTHSTPKLFPLVN